MITRIPCDKCGSEILPTTAEATGGICMACKQGIRRGAVDRHGRPIEEQGLRTEKANYHDCHDNFFSSKWLRVSKKDNAKTSYAYFTLTIIESLWELECDLAKLDQNRVHDDDVKNLNKVLLSIWDELPLSIHKECLSAANVRISEYIKYSPGEMLICIERCVEATKSCISKWLNKDFADNNNGLLDDYADAFLEEFDIIIDYNDNEVTTTGLSFDKARLFLRELSDKKEVFERVSDLVLARRNMDAEDGDVRELLALWSIGAGKDIHDEIKRIEPPTGPLFSYKFSRLTLILKAVGIRTEDLTKIASLSSKPTRVVGEPQAEVSRPQAADIFKKWPWQIVTGFLLMIAILNTPLDIDLPYGYFIFLRFACCAAFSFWALTAHENEELKWRNAFVVIALLYNPFLPVKLGDPVIWMLVNIATMFFVVASGKLFKDSPEDSKN